MDPQSLSPNVDADVFDGHDMAVENFDLAIGDSQEDAPGPQAPSPPLLHSPAPPGVEPSPFVSDLDHMFEQAISEFSGGSPVPSLPRPPRSELENNVNENMADPNSFIWKMNYIDALHRYDMPRLQEKIQHLEGRLATVEHSHAEQAPARQVGKAVGRGWGTTCATRPSSFR